MSAINPERVFDAPLNVRVGADGSVRIFFPSGESITLTAEAAAGSSVLLAQAVSRGSGRRNGQSVSHPGDTSGGNVIPFDFARRALSA